MWKGPKIMSTHTLDHRCKNTLTIFYRLKAQVREISSPCNSLMWCGVLFNSVSVSVSVCVCVCVVELPVIYVPRRTVLVNNGDSAVLVCQAEGIPRPNITWYRDRIQASICTDTPQWAWLPGHCHRHYQAGCPCSLSRAAAGQQLLTWTSQAITRHISRVWHLFIGTISVLSIDYN